jgi:DNA invertase Pin-like site-specific DNA recombinase
MLSAISQFETDLRSERQRDGIAKAKERGVRFGQQKRLTETQVAELQARRQEGELIRELMAGDGLSKATGDR